jgi:hypothetical protein
LAGDLVWAVLASLRDLLGVTAIWRPLLSGRVWLSASDGFAYRSVVDELATREELSPRRFNE